MLKKLGGAWGRGYVKVVSVGEHVVVSGGKTKQDVIGSDCTTTACLTAWEEMVNTLV